MKIKFKILVLTILLFMPTIVRANNIEYFSKIVFEKQNQTLNKDTIISLLSNIYDPSIIEAVLSNGKINLTNKEKGEILNNFVCSKNATTDVLDILTKHIKALNTNDKDGKTPLMKAIECGKDEVFIGHLIDAGLNINLIKNNESALTIAARDGRDEIIGLLIEKGAKIGPKARDLLEHIDELDVYIKNADSEINLYGVNHSEKHNVIKEINFIQNLPSITYKSNKDNNKDYTINIHGEGINDFIKKEAMPSDSDNIFTDLDVNKIWRLYRIFYRFKIKNMPFPTLTMQYIGEATPDKRKETKLEYSKNCIKELENLEEQRREHNPTVCMRHQLESVSFSQRGRNMDMFNRVCMDAHYDFEMNIYPKLKANILNECKRTAKEKTIVTPIKKYGNGAVIYSGKLSPIAVLQIKDGKSSIPISGIPYSRIIEEMYKKYGKPIFTGIENNMVYHYFGPSGSWTPVIRLKFSNNISKIESTSVPETIMTWFIHDNAWQEMNNLLIKTPNTKDAENIIKIKGEEQHKEWIKLQKAYKEKIDSFSL